MECLKCKENKDIGILVTGSFICTECLMSAGYRELSRPALIRALTTIISGLMNVNLSEEKV